ncbi:MAG: thioredoxin-dependent thiol peroxidase [Chloroflexota bacterium]|nr:thioredoxin-dependent thiol peroxidase [Chloroflexota bacterium]
MPQPGDPAPDFTATTDAGDRVSLSNFRGKKVVLYFYPKDDTPGCTKEACAFRDDIAAFDAKNAIVLGVSTDGEASHRRFKQKHALSFPLIADEDKAVVQAYGVWREKKNYGRVYMGTVRSTFIIDEQGAVARVFDNVKVNGHAQAVLDAL